jgi:hypothetical protein
MLLDGRIVFIVGGLHPPLKGLVTEENYAGNGERAQTSTRCNALRGIAIQCTAVVEI